MAQGFRSAVFQLCKQVAKDTNACVIRQTIRDLATVVSNEDNDSIIKKPPHGDLSYIASQQRAQFLGYLLADQAVDRINQKPPLHATRLNENERAIMEGAHRSIDLFISLCLKEIREKYPNASILLDPYIRFERPIMTTKAIPFLSNHDLENCVRAFKKGKVYQKIINNDALITLEKIEPLMLQQLCLIIEKQYSEDLKGVSQETEEFISKLHSNENIGTPDILMVYTTYCYALKNSLRIAAQMIYEAVIGGDMFVMSNDNIIDVSDHRSDYVYDKYTVLVQDVVGGPYGSGVGSIALLNCAITDSHRVKQFGVIVGLTISFISEFGSSTKIRMVTVDEELNEIHRFTDAIMGTELGKMPVVYHG